MAKKKEKKPQKAVLVCSQPRTIIMVDFDKTEAQAIKDWEDKRDRLAKKSDFGDFVKKKGQVDSLGIGYKA